MTSAWRTRDVLRHRLLVGAAPAPAAAARRAPLGAAAGTAAGAAGTAAGTAACGARPASRSRRAGRRRPRRGRARPGARSASAAAGRPCRRPRPSRLVGFGSSFFGVMPSGGRAPRSRMPRSPGSRSCGRWRLLGLGAVRARLLLAGQRGVGVVPRPRRMPSPSRRCRRRSAASSPRRWACCTAWLARGRASWPCVSQVYGLLRDGHGRPQGPVEPAAGDGSPPAVLGLVQPGAATGEPGHGVGHECPAYVSEAEQLRARRARAAPHAAARRERSRLRATTSVSLFASAWWASRPQ